MAFSRILPALSAACVCVFALSGCSVALLMTSQTSQVLYARWKDAPTSGDAAVVPPAFVPHDAKIVTVRTLRDGHGSILRFTSKSRLDPQLCSSGHLTGRPRLDTNWWPIAKPPAEGMRCSPGWRVFVRDGTTYAWSPNS